MLYTNKVKIELNLHNIKEAFQIYHVERKELDCYRDNILDHMMYTYKARSVCANGRNKFYVLLDKGTGIRFHEEVASAYPDTIVREISYHTEEELKEQVPNTKVIIGRLLLNQMQQSHIESLRYNNIMGNLLLPCSHLNKKIGDVDYKRFYEIKLNPNSILKIEMKSFKSKERGRYIIDPLTGQMRVGLSNDVAKIRYDTGSTRPKKAIVNFMDFTDPVKNEKTKMGQLDIVLNDVEQKLGDYMKMNLVPLLEGEEVLQHPSLGKKQQRDRIVGLIKEGGLNLVDLIEDDNSPMDIRYIQQKLQEEFGIETVEGIGRYNLKLIHQPDYYEAMNLTDPYEEWTPNDICQHLIRDNIKDDNINNILHKILQELCIKSDIADEQIKVVNWTELQLEKEWTFIDRKEIILQKWSREKEYIYREVKVSKDGALAFRTYDTRVESTNSKDEAYWDDIIATYKLYEVSDKVWNRTIEGLVYTDIDNIQAIMRTEELIIPEVQKIQNTLLKLDTQGSFNKEELHRYLTEFKWLHSLYIDEITDIEKVVQKEDTISRMDLKKLINSKSAKGKLFNEYLLSQYDILLYPSIRSEENREEYGVANFKGIHYYQNREGNTLSYYVGSNQALNQNLAKGIAIREITSLIDEVDSKEILKLTSVEFVRSGQYTVLPFLYKYLRELAD